MYVYIDTVIPQYTYSMLVKTQFSMVACGTCWARFNQACPAGVPKQTCVKHKLAISTTNELAS